MSRLHELEDLYGSGNVEWLVMEGETLQRVDQEDLGPATEVAPTVHWFLDVEDTTVEFPAREVTHPTEPFRLEYSVPAGDAGPFPSPTLLTGANGVGKTVFANLLAGVIRATQGDVVATTLGRRTRARVLMQDSQKQFLGDPIRKHLARSLGHDSEVRSRAEALATEILSSIARRLADDTATEGVVVEAEDAPTFIESKAVLAAERLASRPCVLVLDEPGWCLSRSVARAFVLAVVDAAHGQGTAVVMISHLRHWWTDLFNSELLFQRLLDPRKGPGLVGIQAVIP